MHAVRDAIYDRLNGGVTYNAAAVPVYDYVPEAGNNAPAKPYICLEETASEPWNTDTSTGAKVRTRVNVYSGYAGAKEANEIAALVRSRLHHYALTLSAGTALTCECQDGDSETLEDGKTRRATVEVFVLVDDIP